MTPFILSSISQIMFFSFFSFHSIIIKHVLLALIKSKYLFHSSPSDYYCQDMNAHHSQGVLLQLVMLVTIVQAHNFLALLVLKDFPVHQRRILLLCHARQGSIQQVLWHHVSLVLQVISAGKKQWMYDSGWITVESMMSKENDEEEMEFREEKGRIRLDTESKIAEGGCKVRNVTEVAC